MTETNRQVRHRPLNVVLLLSQDLAKYGKFDRLLEGSAAGNV